MIKAVILDMDGVIVDTEPVSYGAYQAILKELGKSMELSEYTAHYCGKSEAENARRLIQDYELPFDWQELKERTVAMEMKIFENGVPVKKGIPELIAWLKSEGYPVALATSSVPDRAELLLRSHGLWDVFDARVMAGDFTHGKPDPEVFQIAVQKLGLVPEECLVLEDSENGILAADAAGTPVILIPDLKVPGEAILNKTAAVLDNAWLVKNYLQKQ